MDRERVSNLLYLLNSVCLINLFILHIQRRNTVFIFTLNLALCLIVLIIAVVYASRDCTLKFLSNDLKVSMSAIMVGTGDRKWVRLRGSNGQRP